MNSRAAELVRIENHRNLLMFDEDCAEIDLRMTWRVVWFILLSLSPMDL